MCHSIKIITPVRYVAAAGLLLLLLSTRSMAASSPDYITSSPNKSDVTETGPIVVSIKPLYSLVAHLSEGIEQPVLLMKQAQSPHHYNMRPSERRLLSEARMIIWTGAQLEPHLHKVIKQRESAKQPGVVVSAMQAKNLKLLKLRNKHSHDEDNHSSETGTHTHQLVDPHIWLSTDNAAAISTHIAEQLIINNPEHNETFKNNLQQLLNKIKVTREFIQSSLINSKQPFIAYHDAFQYFEDENSLNFIDAINFDDETGTSLKHMRRIKTFIAEKNIQCLVYQPPRPAIVNTLTKQTSINAIALDPLGLNVSSNKNAWFDLMQQLALNFNQCLNSSGKH